jgi:hypothetical protein
MKNAYNTLVKISEGQRPPQRCRSVSEDNIQMELEEGTMSVQTRFTSLSTRLSGGSCEHGNKL